MPKKITYLQFEKTMEHFHNREEKLRETMLAVRKKKEELECEKKRLQCKLLNTTIQGIYTNFNNQKALLEKQCSELPSEINRSTSILLQQRREIIKLKRSKNKILFDNVKNSKFITFLQKKTINLRKCARQLRGKCISLQNSIQKSKERNEQNNTSVQTALQSSERPSTSAIQPDFVGTFVHSKNKNSEDIPKTFEDSKDRYEKMTEYLSTKLPSRFLPLTVQQANIMDNGKFRLTVRCADETNIFYIIPDLCVLTDEDNKEFYFLEKKISSNNPSLASVCAVLTKGFVVSFHKESFVFKAKSDMSFKMILRNPFEVTDSSIIFPDNTIRIDELDVLTIKKVLRTEFIQLLSMKYGVKFGDEYDNNIAIKSGRDVDSTRSEAELAQALFDVFPNISNYYRYSHKRIYHCDEKTNIWNSLTNYDFYRQIRQKLERKIQLTEAELINNSTTDIVLKIRDIIVRKIEDVNFTEQLDSVSNLFVTDNKAIDMSIIPPVIRSIKCEDLIKTTTGWTYDPGLSCKYKKSVKSYFNKLLPKPCEQRWFLSFIARMLNGKRCNEPCVILTDNRGGKSGKSTLIHLLRAVFGNYYVNDSTIVPRRTKYFIRSSQENKRLLVVDGLEKNETLNCDFIKSTINYDYSNRRSIFPVNVGLIIVSNTGKPILDTSDEDFLKMIVTCPMRSRFVSKKKMAHMKKHGEDITDTYIADNSLRHQFSEWRSAVLDFLLEFYKGSLPPVPDSMIDCNNSNFHDNDFYVNWLDTHISVVKNSGSFVTALQIVKQMKESNKSCDIECLKSAMNVWTEKNKCTYRHIYVYMDEQKKFQIATYVVQDAAFCNTGRC
ncbi:GfV-D1-ORF1 [Ichnoviriform fumiferanae]|uniref:GfV-D1-ORF1 n=1 Tax=Ichnoviriform fumiferanae TaxID=419435 RepID=A2PZZ1_9VIRU|nr:GfV-D1-ORF1 [Ichnoviriform fumiferanae]BAF45563.1 GfV-D1-ORF1 [Ichnoviriform fumiferanae]